MLSFGLLLFDFDRGLLCLRGLISFVEGRFLIGVGFMNPDENLPIDISGFCGDRVSSITPYNYFESNEFLTEDKRVL